MSMTAGRGGLDWAAAGTSIRLAMKSPVKEQISALFKGLGPFMSRLIDPGPFRGHLPAPEVCSRACPDKNKRSSTNRPLAQKVGRERVDAYRIRSDQGRPCRAILRSRRGPGYRSGE